MWLMAASSGPTGEEAIIIFSTVPLTFSESKLFLPLLSGISPSFVGTQPVNFLATFSVLLIRIF